MKSAMGKESDQGSSSMSSLVVKAIIGEWSGSGLLASSSGTKEVIGEGDSDSVLLSTYTIGEGEEYVFRIIIGCGLVLIFGEHRFILYDITEYYQGSRSVQVGSTHLVTL